MPIDNIKRTIHLRRRKNQRIMQNVARLWELGKQAQSHQELLEGLHPWGTDNQLRFDNVLPILLAVIAGCCLLSIWILPAGLPSHLAFWLALGLGFYSYLTYEQSSPIAEVIEFLEQQTITQKYSFQFYQTPVHISMPVQPSLFQAYLKNLFPLFQQGQVSNTIPVYASTVWTDDQGQQYPVLLFQYHFVNEIRMRDRNGNETKVKEVHKDLWGVFIFQVAAQGLAVTSSRKTFEFPYLHDWHTSDIQINQKLRIFGANPLQLAKTLTPAMVLRLDQLFATRSGDLLLHPEQPVLCFLGEQDLFKISTKTQNIDDISKLRGHLRTFRLAEYENLQRDLIAFLK
ncbi:hypothetical protein [Acinetobacter sp. CAAS 2-6]|uniref:hypothetical protein n=1 Tax=Acinetobacter sp. CAAS 2-6 TaxID=3016358 RepID=UPI002DD64CA7|nr:hypothetical protein [Acinetobacter sp. CAAS 2-6]